MAGMEATSHEKKDESQTEFEPAKKSTSLAGS
jgi:hypothetical protein